MNRPKNPHKDMNHPAFYAYAQGVQDTVVMNSMEFDEMEQEIERLKKELAKFKKTELKTNTEENV